MNFAALKKELKDNGFEKVKGNDDKITASRGDMTFEFVCVGGGRIEHQYEGKVCSIYGYSQSYGPIDHSFAQSVISKHLGYPLESILLNEKEY